MKNCNQDTERITKSKRIQCKQCDKKFNKEHTFKTHMKSVHNEQTTEARQKEIFNNSKLTFHDTRRNLRSNKNSKQGSGPPTVEKDSMNRN